MREEYVISFSVRTSARAIESCLRHVQHAGGIVRTPEAIAQPASPNPENEELYKAMKQEAYGGSSGYYGWRSSAAWLHSQRKPEAIAARKALRDEVIAGVWNQPAIPEDEYGEMAKRLVWTSHKRRNNAIRMKKQRAELGHTLPPAPSCDGLFPPGQVSGDSVQSPSGQSEPGQASD